jgi:hypothetical protein
MTSIDISELEDAIEEECGRYLQSLAGHEFADICLLARMGVEPAAINCCNLVGAVITGPGDRRTPAVAFGGLLVFIRLTSINCHCHCL